MTYTYILNIENWTFQFKRQKIWQGRKWSITTGRGQKQPEPEIKTAYYTAACTFSGTSNI